MADTTPAFTIADPSVCLIILGLTQPFTKKDVLKAHHRAKAAGHTDLENLDAAKDAALLLVESGFAASLEAVFVADVAAANNVVSSEVSSARADHKDASEVTDFTQYRTPGGVAAFTHEDALVQPDSVSSDDASEVTDFTQYKTPVHGIDALLNEEDAINGRGIARACCVEEYSIGDGRRAGRRGELIEKELENPEHLDKIATDIPATLEWGARLYNNTDLVFMVAALEAEAICSSNISKPLRNIGLSSGYYVHSVSREPISTAMLTRQTQHQHTSRKIIAKLPFDQVIKAITEPTYPITIVFYSPDEPVDEVEHQFSNDHLKKELIEHLSHRIQWLNNELNQEQVEFLYSPKAQRKGLKVKLREIEKQINDAQTAYSNTVAIRRRNFEELIEEPGLCEEPIAPVDKARECAEQFKARQARINSLQQRVEDLEIKNSVLREEIVKKDRTTSFWSDMTHTTF